MVLKHPFLPLHNNDYERDIREYVKRRKISGSTKSETGPQARDTFTSLKKTCKKLGVAFWEYLRDRLVNEGQIPRLAYLIKKNLRDFSQSKLLRLNSFQDFLRSYTFLKNAYKSSQPIVFYI